MLLNSSGVDSGRSYLFLRNPGNIVIRDKFNNGLVWMMDSNSSFMKNAPAGSFGHTGFTGTSIVVVPALKVSVILLINRQNMGLIPAGNYFNPNPLGRSVFEKLMTEIK